MRKFYLLITILTLSAAIAFGSVVAPMGSQAQPIGPQERIPGVKLIAAQTALDLGDLVDFDAAMVAGADYLQSMQADITDDNAGNGTDGVDETPDDPDDGGWDWSSSVFSHSTSASPRNIYGATALGLYQAYLETGDADYFTALTDAANFMISDHRDTIRTASDIIFLLLFNDLPGVSGTTYQDSARGKYEGRLTAWGGSGGAIARYIRDARNGQGYGNGIIAWDVGLYARAAAMLDSYFPGNGYDLDADSIAEVLYQDSYMDNPGYFDIVDDAGYDAGYGDVNFYWYNLGISGLIDAFAASGHHTSEIPALITTLLESQNSQGFVSFQYGGNAGDEDWQSTAYAMMSLGRYDQATYQTEINWMGYFVAATQDGSGGWLYSSGNHYPEEAGEATAGLYYTTDGVSDVVVDDDFTGQDDVDVYNAAHSTSYVWGYTAFATIADAMAAVTGSTIHLAPGTYYEALHITLDGLTIIGDDEATVIIDPTGMAYDNAGIYVDADNVTLQSFTLNATVTTSLPRYGIKVADVDGCVIEDVTATEVYRSGFDCLGSTNLTLTNISTHDNGGHGLALTDCNGVDVTDFYANNNGWQNVSVATWGRYTPLGCSDIVFGGTNTFGDLFQLEMGDYNNPGVPPAGAAIITYSTNIVDGADVTVQAADFGYALHGTQDDAPDIARVWFFSTLANAAIIPGLGGGGHWTGAAMFIESLLDGTQLYITPGCDINAAIVFANPAGGTTINVQTGTYAQSPLINKSLGLVGVSAASTAITGGIQISGSFDGLLIEGLTLSGDAAGWKTSVIDSRPTTGPVSDITVRDCVLDGENIYGRYCFYGNFITGNWTFDGNEIKNFITWYVIDNTGSGHDVPYKLDEVHFTDNWVHDCGGSIAFRGKIDEPMDYAVISGNTMEDYLPSASSEVWAAIEINNVADLEVFDNTITDVPEASWGGEGQPLQIWSASPWSVDIHDNDFSGNFQGIYIWALLEDALWSGPDTPLYVPSGSIYHNDFSNNTQFGLWISDLPVGSGTSSALGGPLDAEQNYWGYVAYNSILAYVSANIDFDPWCVDNSYTNCTLTYPVTEVWVDDDWAGSSEGDIVGGHIFGYDAFATIQDGVDGVQASTVHIAPGTYVEQVHATLDNLTLEGSGIDVTTIKSPVNLTESFNTGSNDNFPVVFVDGAVNVTITDLTVDGDKQGATNVRFVGIGFWNGGGTVDGVKVINVMNNPLSGAQHGVGIYSYNNTGGPYSIALQNVNVYDFQKNAVALLGGGLTVDVNNVTATGAGATSITAQNGIQVGAGVSGTVDNCTIADAAYTGGTWTATGFLNEGAVAATGIDISGCQTSVYWIDGSGSFTGGTITNPVGGDGFYAYNSTTAKAAQPKVLAQPLDAELMANNDKAVMSVTLTGTDIIGVGLASSWGIGAFSTSTDPVNLTVDDCTVKGWDYGLVGYDYGGPVNCEVYNSRFLGNGTGITTSAATTIGMTVYGNSFANTINAEDYTAGGAWDDGASVGNCWSDFETNSGYPTNYLVGGTAGVYDNYPNTDCGIGFGPDDILYHCDGDLDIEVGIGDGVLALEGAEMVIEYPAEMTLVSVAAADANYFLAYSLTDNASGTDVLLVNLGVQTGWQDGPADLFTVTLNGSTSYCGGTTISMTSAELRDTANAVITMPLPGDIALLADCNDPVLTVNTADGDCYNIPPVVNIEAADDCDLDAVYYQIDGCGAAGWQLKAGSLAGTTYGPADYTMSAGDFLSLSEGTHCVYFKVTDDNERGNADSCDCWQFTKDTTPPTAPTDLTAAPGHNKVELSWTNPGGDFDHVVVMRSDWNGSGHGYPEYGSPDNGSAEGSYPTDTSSFDLVYAGTGNTLTDTDDISNTTRDIYHYTVFAVDCAGNTSTPAAGSETRATSYWLGDVAGSGGPGDYDGYVYSQDLSVFSFAYWTGPLAINWNAECDFAPTEAAKAGPKDIPVPDDSVEFEDLIIFAINYDDVSPVSAKNQPIFTSSPNSPGTYLYLKGRVEGEQYLVDVILNNGRDAAKAVDAELTFDTQNLKYIATERSSELRNTAQGVFFQAHSAGNRVFLSAAVLGEDLTFTGSGVLATIRFELGQSGSSSVEIVKSLIRGVNNEDVNTGTPAAGIMADVDVPSQFSLEQNSPNPFNPLTEIAYGLPNATQVTLKVYNITGQVVKTLVEGYQQAGRHSVTWDATNVNGQRVASGVYFYRFETAEFQKTVKMTLLK